MMNESLLSETAEISEGEDVAVETGPNTGDDQPMRPDGVPEKFWDQKNGSVRVEALAKSYQELERKLGGEQLKDVPESADDYEITIDGNPIETDAEVNSRLHAAGLSRDQVQAVYDLANEKLMPALAEMTASFEADSQTQQLIKHFGGEQNWAEARRQIGTWGRENFSEDVFAALSGTYDGVLTMQRMMSGNEPGLGQTNTAGHAPSESSLKEMMADPRYWRQRDPAYVEQVRQGFRALYPDS